MPQKHMRLPNGFGQISFIKNRKLRNPWRAMITVGKSDTGKPISKPLKPKAYFKSYNEAYQALMEYHRNPYDPDKDITMQQLYEKWFDPTKSTAKGNRSAWNYSSTIANMKVSEVRIRHMRACIEQAEYKGKPATPTIKKNMKTNFNCMLDLAVELEIVDRNYARQFTLKNTKKEIEESRTSHVAFTNEELDLLWKNKNYPYVDVILIQCYSGWRPQELSELLIENVDLAGCTFTGGIKTDAGKQRCVPIHSAIIPLVEKYYLRAVKMGYPYLFNCEDNINRRDDTMLNYDRMRPRFANIVRDVLNGTKHTLHDGRKTFVTLCKNAGVNEYAIKRMVGHHIDDITESVYTDRPSSWFREEIEKIQV